MIIKCIGELLYGLMMAIMGMLVLTLSLSILIVITEFVLLPSLGFVIELVLKYGLSHQV